MLKAASRTIPRERRNEETPWWCEEANKVVEERKEGWKEHQVHRAEALEFRYQQMSKKSEATLNWLWREEWRGLASHLERRVGCGKD